LISLFLVPSTYLILEDLKRGWQWLRARGVVEAQPPEASISRA
jgi:hypothetical protein